MKRIVAFVFLLLPISVWAQNRPVKDTLYIVNGVVAKNLDGLNKGDIISRDTLKGNSISALYGRGLDCVIVIGTKQKKIVSENVRLVSRASVTNDEPLFLLNNRPVAKSEIDTSNTILVQTLKGAQAMALYGSKGANGVFIYVTKIISKVNETDTVRSFVITCMASIKQNSEPLLVINGMIKKG